MQSVLLICNHMLRVSEKARPKCCSCEYTLFAATLQTEENRQFIRYLFSRYFFFSKILLAHSIQTM